MPEKDLNNWAAFLQAIPEPVRAALLGGFIAFLRIMYDDREPRFIRRLMESVLCGAIALSVAHLTEAIGLPQGWSTFLGGAVGLIGAEQVREWARRLGEAHISKGVKP